jgi:type VI secretion system protein ImpG
VSFFEFSVKDFLNYYQDELLSLRAKGGVFAKKYPEIAEYIDIKDGQSTDPHTERIIESVAFIAAKLHQRIDDNAEYIAFHILNAVYPNLVNPLPPCSVVKFVHEFAGNLHIPRHSYLSSYSKLSEMCSFRTMYPTTLYPVEITKTSLEKNIAMLGGEDLWCLKVDIQTKAGPINDLAIDRLLFHINSNIIEDALIMYESIFANGNVSAFINVNNKIIKLKNGSIRPCGFEDEDTVCPVTKYSTNIFQLFQEMLHFKQKFMFFEISNINGAIQSLNEKDLFEFSIIIDISFTRDRLLQIVKDDTLLLNCVPIANLFPYTSDPFRFTGEQNKYLLIADQLNDKRLEIHSIWDVHIIDGETSEDSIVQPYFALSVDSDTNIHHELFWVHSREASDIRGISGNDIYMSFIDINMNPHASYDSVVYAKLLCMNRMESRDIPVFARMDIEGIETGGTHGILLYKTSNSVEFSNNSTNLWNLVSQLSSTNISVARGEDMLLSIRQIVKMFSAGIGIRADELISHISKISCFPIVRRFGNDAWRGFVRGIEVNVWSKDDDKSYFSFLLCSIINQYLSSCVSLNSFIQMNLISEKTNLKIRKWNPSSGKRDVL